MTTDNRFALDAAAVVQQLSREIAGMQARAVAQRALIEAAASLQRPDICERAATEVQIYEDAAARLLQVVQNIVTGRGVVAQPASGAAPPVATASHDATAGASKPTAPQPPSSPLTPMQDVRYRVAMNAQNAPHKRHEAMVQLLVQLTAPRNVATGASRAIPRSLPPGFPPSGRSAIRRSGSSKR